MTELQTTTEVVEANETVLETVEKNQEKTFTQKELNDIVAKQTKEAQEKLLKKAGFTDFENAKEGMAKFIEWQESQKTEAQKQQEAYEQAQALLNAEKQRAQSLETQLLAIKLGVDNESFDDFIVLSKAKVNDNITLEQAMQETLEKYPHFKGVTKIASPSPKFTTGTHIPKQETGNDPFRAILDKL